MREADAVDFAALRDLEQSASVAALGHIFPPDRYPYPADRVLARWRLVLDDSAVTVLVEECSGELLGLAAYDDRWLQHLAVHPDRWRGGLGTGLQAASLAAMAERGARTAHLWVLADNHGARRFYEHTGWRLAADEREAEYPPHPPVVSYARDLGDFRREPRDDRDGRAGSAAAPTDSLE
ncbi:MAG: GNAT family N-acetyltransferase [Propionibacteriales bacterium]|nr:GNAT family N-acetyltransferase [Propionibacteriales bacterium]